MCYHIPFDRLAVPWINDVEGIKTMPVSAPEIGLGRRMSILLILN